MPISVVDEYAETVVVRSITTIDGVANVEFYGQAHPAVRIQVDPYALAVRGIGIDQVAAAVRRENVDLALLPTDWPLCGILRTNSQWWIAGEDDQAVLFVHGKPKTSLHPNQELPHGR